MQDIWKPSPDQINPDKPHLRRGLLVEEHLDYPVKPKDIDTSRHFGDGFSNFETENAARIIVNMCKERDSWDPFTTAELDAYLEKEFGKTCKFNFYGLVETQDSTGIDKHLEPTHRPFNGGWLVERSGTYHFTVAFVERLHDKFPLKPDR